MRLLIRTLRFMMTMDLDLLKVWFWIQYKNGLDIIWITIWYGAYFMAYVLVDIIWSIWYESWDMLYLFNELCNMDHMYINYMISFIYIWPLLQSISYEVRQSWLHRKINFENLERQSRRLKLFNNKELEGKTYNVSFCLMNSTIEDKARKI